MTELLIKKFVKNYENLDDIAVRTRYGILTSVIGILANTFLFLVKFIIGIVLNSISVTADAFNNLSDAASSIISFVGVKMAEKPADKDHPFGHGRIEYIAAFIVAFLVIQVGFTFFRNSIVKILHPDKLVFDYITILILFLSIGIKLFLALFNRKIGKRISSKVMMATAADAMGDCIITSVTILSLLVSHFSKLNIDGGIGLLVSLFIMWAGINIAKETLEPLIGEGIDPVIYETLTNKVESYDGIVGTHDLLVHNYGPSRSMASIHAEVPKDVDIEISHEIIDRIEKEVFVETGVFLVIHMDPVETKDSVILDMKEQLREILEKVDSELSYHDFRCVRGKYRTNLIFDMVVPREYSVEMEENALEQVMSLVKKWNPGYECVITVDRSFIASGKE